MKQARLGWSSIKQAIVILVLLSTLTTYKILESDIQLRTQFSGALIAWHVGSLSLIIWTTWLTEQRLLCNWFRCSFLKIGLSRIIVYLSFSTLMALASVFYYQSILNGLHNVILFWNSLIFYASVYFITAVAMEVSKLVGKGFIEKLILGKYHLPRKEERIFLFVDLKESTKLSKELSLENYSLLVKEFFHDIDKAMEKFDGEIYQYAGDQVIVSWPALASNYDKAVRSFIEFYNQMKTKRPDYIHRYGVVPSFKAAIHCGIVIATWMGRMKRELVFQGEVLNITARVTGLAKNLSYPILLTQEIANNLGESVRKRVLQAGNYYLKGIDIPINIYFLRLEERLDHVQKSSGKMKAISKNDAEMSEAI